ncbi:DUF2238 domain-containing protein [Streptomyces sporangiiformans]|uniref:DUF2238 domain-containing protein n=1 Tax=Streptomyces sporangiiformans TaxID=2315329 RepID=A0A505DR86_9ACTN|nr:DUF2238 domain-containing protein [Streptomyces sporangiiformans]TPQ23757.1 DUF2238 domain-containing protein [Streptomyces sporangiiformans]
MSAITTATGPSAQAAPVAHESSDRRTGRRLPTALVAVVAVALAVSAWHPKDPTTWLLETVWVLVGVPLAILLRKRFPLSNLLCCLLAVHALVLIVGGHYTYAEVPAGDWVRDWFDLERNPYDRFGHLMQGFVPAVLVREILTRTSPLRGSRWLAPLTVCACLAFSAVFEMLEWAAAVTGGHAADAFLATQGDVWDTQWDMFCALIGATGSLLLLSRVHDRHLARLELTPVGSVRPSAR